MQTVNIQRTTRQGKAVRGTITIPLEQGSRHYPTLENADYLIPAGTYPLRLTWSPRFKKMLPLIDEVPDREGIRIHLGTRPEHSTGCVLVSQAAIDDLQILFNQRLKWYDESELRIRIEGLDQSPL